MRKLILPLILASALVPAAASAQDNDGGTEESRVRAERSDRAQRSEDRGARAERRFERMQRMQRSDRPQRAEPQVQAQRDEPQADAPRSGRIRGERNRDGRRPTLIDGFGATVRDGERRREAEVQRREAEISGEGQDSARDGDRDRRRGFGGAIVESVQRDNRDDRDNRDRWSGRDGRDRWSSDWRRDRRYDWRNHRDRHGWRFRAGRYYDPFGWRYRRFPIGFSLYPSYYSSRYWLSDPWAYRLPPAYGPYRWVRYYDDALLVNIYNGRVVDVIHSFFW